MTDMSEKKQWKRVGDYPPPKDRPLLARNYEGGSLYAVTTPEQWTPTSDVQWIEVDIPTEVADPPVDEQLEEEAKALREAWKIRDERYANWDQTTDFAKRRWRDVARKARELHTNPWRPMSELEDRHVRRVLVKRENGTVLVIKGTSRPSDKAYRREFWKEID